MNGLRVCIIAHSSRSGGSLAISLNLLEEWKKIASDDHVMIVCSQDGGYEDIDLPANWKLYVYKGSHLPHQRVWFEKVTLPGIVKRFNPDVILGLGNIALTHPPAPQAIVVQQAYLFYGQKHYPEQTLYHRIRIAALRSQVKKVLRKTQLVFIQTPPARRRFANTYQYPIEQIKLMPMPPSGTLNTVADAPFPEIIDGSSSNFYFLLLAPYMSHRNPSVLIPLCRKYKSQLFDKQIKFITTVEPQDHANSQVFLDNIAKYHLEDVILPAGRLPYEELPAYYAHSDAFWLPTLLECLATGHIEAMTAGLPILAPDLDFAHYVCDKAAVYYDPWDIDNIFAQIMNIRENQSLRQYLISEGKKELSKQNKFAKDWNEVALGIVAELRRIAQTE